MNARATPRHLREQRLIEGVVVSLALFRGASPTQVAVVASQCRPLQVSRGELIAPINQRLPGIFAVAYGTVKLAIRHAEGEERVLRLVQAGQTFGESTALLDRPSRYEARALAECRLLVIPPLAVFSLVERDPRAARQVLRTLAAQNFERMSELESSSMRRGAQRLASYLDSLAEPSGENGSCTVRLPATKTVIASRLDMKKETLSRLLRALAEQGLIAVTQRDITILDRGRLAQIVG